MALQARGANDTLRSVQPTSAAQPDQSPQPRGVGLTALALGTLIAVYFVRSSFQFFGGPLAAFAIFEQLIQCGAFILVLILLWNYWKGQNWGRIFVLLWSFLIAARELSALIDHDANLTALMSRPLRFFQTLLAIFLLYWLNTLPVRDWFKRMSATVADLIADHLVGKLCTAVEKNGGDSGDLWRLSFEHDTELILHCPWRIVLDDNLAFASNAPVEFGDEEEEARRLLQNLRVHALRVTPRTSDLFIAFEMGIELQTWSTNPQSRQWEFVDPTLSVIADSAELNMQFKPSSKRPDD